MAGHNSFRDSLGEDPSIINIGSFKLENLIPSNHNLAQPSSPTSQSTTANPTHPRNALITTSPVQHLGLRQNNPQDCSNLVSALVDRATVEISRTIIALNATFSQQLQQASISASDGIKQAQVSATSTVSIVVQSASIATSSAFSSVTVANKAVTSANIALTSVQESITSVNLALQRAQSTITSATSALSGAQSTITSVNLALTNVSSSSSSDVSRLSSSLSLLQASVVSVQVSFHIYATNFIMLTFLKGVCLCSNCRSTISTCICDWISSGSGIINPRFCRQKYTCSFYHFHSTRVANFNCKSVQQEVILQSDQKNRYYPSQLSHRLPNSPSRPVKQQE